MADFGTLNWSILIAYILLNLLLGFVLSKRVSTAEDFYLGRRTTPWWAIGISVIATYVSALSFLGGPAWSYTESLAVIAIHLNYPIVIFVIISVFLPFFFNSGVASIYEYMERRFGPASRVVISGVFLVSQALTSAAILYATSLVIEFITGIQVEYAIIIVTVVALIYTMMGGITAVIWTDVIQAGVLFVGAGIILYALLTQMPAPIGEVLADLKAQGKLNTLDFSLDFGLEATVWSGVIAMTIFHVTVYGANQMMVQRTLAAKNIGDAKKSFLLMGFVAFFIYFLFFLLGVLFYGYFDGKEFENGNTIILSFAADYGLPGLMGIIAAAIVAASMSSLDSSFNSLATISTIDFYQRYYKTDESPEHYLKVSRVFTLVWAVLIILPAFIYINSEGSVLQTLSKIGSYFVGAKLSMYGLGFFSKQTTERGLLVGVAVGFVMIWYLATQTDIAWPWYCLFGGGVNIVVALLASRILDGRQDEWSEYSIKGQKRKFKEEGLPEKENGWYLVPGKVDKVSYWLLFFFVATLLFLASFEALAKPAPKTIAELRNAAPVVELRLEGSIEGGPGYTSELYSYLSSGLKVYALVARPTATVPAGGWPTLIANHGHHPDPPQYGITSEGKDHRPGDYYRQVLDRFVANGYLVVMPDYRGHNNSEGFEFTEGMLESAYYTEDVLNLLAGLADIDDVDHNRVFMWGHSMGGEVTLRTLLVAKAIKAASMWSSVGGDIWDQSYYYSRYSEPLAMDSSVTEKSVITRLRGRIKALDGEFDTESVEPYRYLDDLATPIIIQHAVGDRGAAYKWSERLAKELYMRGKTYEFWSYAGNEHLFSGADLDTAIRRDIAFFEFH